MAASITIQHIITQVKQLDSQQQLTLLKRLASLLKRAESTTAPPKKLTSLSSLGGEIWKGVEDIDRYIDEERRW